MDVIAVNRAEAIALTEDGDTLPITLWIGSDGCSCDEEDAVAAIALSPDCWVVIDLSQYERQELN